jgi:uncharacterized protein
MESCIYEGRVRHTRTWPARHRFSYRLFMMYLDLDELGKVFDRRWLWSATRPAVARFRREDHLGPASQPLVDAVRELVAAETGAMPPGPVRLLTNLSYFGYCFNPVSFYYCYANDGESVQAIVAEVNNTPWGERDTYVMDCRTRGGSAARWRFRPTKKMHVSPFMPMEIEYDWALAAPADRLAVYMASSKDGERIFDAALSLRRTEIDGWALARMLLKFPLHTLRVIVAIYWQAFRLWLKRCPLYVHPKHRRALVVKDA